MNSGFPLPGMPENPNCFRWRFIPMRIEHAAMNMAIDEALLLSYLKCLSPQTIRISGWRRRSLTYGYRIDPAEVDPRGCGEVDVIRRPTGGGVVYHGECVTLSIVGCVSSLREWGRCQGLPPHSINKASTLYRAVNPVVKDALSALGMESYLIPESASWNARIDCFTNPCAHDIASGGRKIYGAAQLRVGRAFLYQGNLSVEKGFDVAGFSRAFCNGLSIGLGWDIVEGELSGAELEEAERLCRAKYGSGDWNRFGRYPQGRPMRPVARS